MVFATSGRAGDFPRKASVYLTNNESKETGLEFSLPLLNTRIILAYLGSVPCLFKHPYSPSWDIKRSSCLYSIFILTAISCDCVITVFDLMEQHDAIDPSEVLSRLIKIELCLLIVTHLIALALFCDAEILSVALEEFRGVEATFLKATGTRLENRRRKLEIFFDIFMLTSSPSLYLFCRLAVPAMGTKLYMVPGILYGPISGVGMVVFVVGILLRAVDVIEDLKTDFNKHVVNGDLTSTMVFDYRKVWLSLRAFMDAMSQMHAYSTGYTVSMFLSSIYLYKGATLITMGDNILAVCGHFATAGVYIVSVVLCCYTCHYIRQKMRTLVTEVLPTVELSSYDLGTQREIVMLFLVEGARPATSTFREMVTADKKLILAFVSNVSTYIIVLAQYFQKSDGTVG